MEDYSFLRLEWPEWEKVDTAQKRGAPAPPVEKPCPPDAEIVRLPVSEPGRVSAVTLQTALRRRRSRRHFAADPISLAELAFLLWATQGVREVTSDGVATKRTVPSGGSRHPIETYLSVHRVGGLAPGLYRYLPVEHALAVLARGDFAERTCAACRNQQSIRESVVTFIWTAIPYRTEWRYAPAAPKLVALDAGHVCQNLYLACEAIGCGTCAIAAYSQRLLDALVGADGRDEFAVYAAPVGKIAGE